ncbi:MAG: hypothetical protein SGARI_004135 [Bacillariaceae sp.]
MEREVDPTDFYFEDPALQYPMSPKSLHKEINSVVLAPSKELFSEVLKPRAPKTRRLFVPALRKQIRNKLHKRKRAAAATMSPGSQDTESTMSNSSRSINDKRDFDDGDDAASSCGSLTYSVESADMAYMLDDDGQVVRRRMGEHKCFQLFDGIVEAFEKLFPREPERQQGPTAYFEFDKEILKANPDFGLRKF